MASEVNPTPDSTREQQHCPECSHRRLVCDGTRPACQKCLSRGLTCPGYRNTRPLKWLTPGRVTSRTRGKTRRGTGRPVHPVSVSMSNCGNHRDSSESNQVSDGGWFSGYGESGEEVASPVVAYRHPTPVDLFPNTPLVSEVSNIVQARLYRVTNPLHFAPRPLPLVSAVRKLTATMEGFR